METKRDANANLHLTDTFGDVIDIVAAAVALGAVDREAQLSAHERLYVERARRRAAPRAAHLSALVSQIVAGGDPLGTSLMRLRSRSQRRRIGSFYTPQSVIAPMVSWVLSGNPSVIVDPGCGSGRFSAAVATVSPTTRVIAIDSDPIATLIARAVFAVLGMSKSTVINRDFLSLSTIPRRRGERIGWIGNPPFVRHQLLSRASKGRGLQLAAHAGHRSVMTTGLHVQFFTKTHLLSEVGDRGCYVTPTQWIENRSGRLVRELLRDGLGGDAIIIIDPEECIFDGVKTTAAITTFVVGSSDPSRRFAYNVSLTALSGGLHEIGFSLPITDLPSEYGWTRAMTSSPVEPTSSPTIGSLFRVSRGTATGANSFFVMRHDEAARYRVERFAVETVTRAQEIISADGILTSSSARRVVLEFPKHLDRAKEKDVDEYLRRGERPSESGLVVANGSNAQKRSPWWSFRITRPAIIATYMARRPPAFAANPHRIGVLNIALGLEPRIAMDNQTLFDVVQILNEEAPQFEDYAVRYFGNLRKFEPNALARLPLPRALHRLIVDLDFDTVGR